MKLKSLDRIDNLDDLYNKIDNLREEYSDCLTNNYEVEPQSVLDNKIMELLNSYFDGFEIVSDWYNEESKDKRMVEILIRLRAMNKYGFDYKLETYEHRTRFYYKVRHD